MLDLASTRADKRKPGGHMARVVVVGGGYGGASLARPLDADLDVVLVEPKDAFVHSRAALRAVVDATWQDRVFFPYDRLLTRGRVVQDWARRVSPRRVTISPFESIDADYLVLATGTSYPFPAKFLEDETEVAIARLGRLREALARTCLLYTSPSPRDRTRSRMPSSA